LKKYLAFDARKGQLIAGSVSPRLDEPVTTLSEKMFRSVCCVDC